MNEKLKEVAKQHGIKITEGRPGVLDVNSGSFFHIEELFPELKEQSNLYVVREEEIGKEMLYSFNELEKRDKVGEEVYSYIEPVIKHIDKDIYVIVDNDNSNYEVIKSVKDNVFESITVLNDI